MYSVHFISDVTSNDTLLEISSYCECTESTHTPMMSSAKGYHNHHYKKKLNLL